MPGLAGHWWRYLGWVGFCAAVAALGAINGLGVVDDLIADRLLRLSKRAVPQDVVIVAIDDPSLAALGRWPWRRELHAELLDHLARAQVSAVGMDLILSEPDPSGDPELARAMRGQGRVVLPLHMSPTNDGGLVALPVAPLAAAAAGLGHVHTDLDADGVVRGLYLREGFGALTWEYFALAVLRLSDPAVARYAVRGVDAGGSPPAGADVHADTGWRRDAHFLVRFAGPAGTVRQYSYVDVLRGRVPPEQLRGAVVFVGATSPGLADMTPTPLNSGQVLMSGVEAHAQAFVALREGWTLRPLTAAEGAALAVLPLVLVLAGLRWGSPRLGLALTLLMLPLVVMVAWGLLQFGVRWLPAAALIGVLAAYPLWSWRRLEAAMRFLDDEFRRVGARLHGRAGAPPEARRGDGLDRRIHSLQAAAQRLATLEAQREEAVNFLSHDLRAPLSGALALIALHEGQRGDPLLGRIEAQLRAALEMAEGYLHLARAQAPEPDARELLDLRDVATEAVDLAWDAARQRGVRLTCELPPEPCLAEADGAMLRRALGNLIDNALKYGRPKAPVCVMLQAKPDGWRLAVDSEGTPIAAELAAGLFEHFRQRDGSSGGGVGLGLALVDAVARRHDGSAGWEALPAGNRFFVDLPVAADLGDQEA